ncbi:hypothetical protein BN159_2024 [Streptomyces davaonensis JCM 4913]|uniref:Uncharacterized protein n=1 Tax=Streptomyces davaonensis (strain DSM 101723 / JCM 4913 / KCC S-0913 / 768) TaxID=1214101 RepID=K4QZB1_STRDJ|nr:hypothetical protein [Streptomyces davaonensis]CCK26403.1 hypothetical protein BN159_2024 [Streptomyces davaonensis JCM 4913]
MSGTGSGLTVHPDEAEALAWVMLAELSGTEPVPPPGAEVDVVVGDGGEG